MKSAALALLTLLPAAIAQTDPRPQFEVASIKPAAPDARGMFIMPGPGGGLRITNMNLKELIVIAYRTEKRCQTATRRDEKTSSAPP